MKPVVTTLIAAALFCAAAVPSTAFAVQPGYVGPKDPVLPRGPWEARVRWVDVHVDSRSGMVYTYRYLDIVGATQQYCEQQLAAVMSNPGVSVVEYCAPA